MKTPLITMEAVDGSSLILYEESQGGPLMFQHERPGVEPGSTPVPVRRLGPEGRDLPEPVNGRLNAFPVQVGGLAHVVLCGEISPPVDRVILGFSTKAADRKALYPDWEQLYLVPLGLSRRVWSSHEIPYFTGMQIIVRWMHGDDVIEQEKITVGSTHTSYGYLP